MAYDNENAKETRPMDSSGMDVAYQTPQRVPRQGIGWAIKQMEHGLKVRRQGWNGRGMWIELQRPDITSKMTLPYIYMKTADNHLVPWLASQTDLLCMDWEVATV